MNKHFFILSVVVGLFYLSSCSKSSDSANTEGSPNAAQDSLCKPEYTPTDSNVAIAVAFNEYRLRCSPSDTELNYQLESL